MKWLKRHFVTIILLLILFVGISLLLYPTVSDYWNSFHQSRSIATYVEEVANMDEDEYQRMVDEAEAYNKTLGTDNSRWLMSDEEKVIYESLLDLTNTGVMGYIEIPAIDVSLPIYHGTDENVLQVAIGHIEGSSLPVGGYDTHCVLSGHRGLPSAKLFTDIDKLTEGDIFILQILGKTLTYEVDQIRIVLPDQMSDLDIVEGEDYCTLVTCTPYGVNSHRMLVRGHRIANDTVSKEIRVSADAIEIEPMVIATIISVPMLLVIIIFIFATTSNKKKRERRKESEQH